VYSFKNTFVRSVTSPFTLWHTEVIVNETGLYTKQSSASSPNCRPGQTCNNVRMSTPPHMHLCRSRKCHIQYRVKNSSPLVPTPRQIIPFQLFKIEFLKIHFNIILSSTPWSFKWLLSLTSTPPIHCRHFSSLHTYYLIHQFFPQYSETNVMHFLFSLLRIMGLYMLRALLAHPQEALNKRHLVYCVRVMSVSCTRIGAANSQSTSSWFTILIYYDARSKRNIQFFPLSIVYEKYVWKWLKIKNFHFMEFSPFSFHFLTLRSKHFTQCPTIVLPQPMLFLYHERPSFTPTYNNGQNSN
jgi:hypothetical protein